MRGVWLQGWHSPLMKAMQSMPAKPWEKNASKLSLSSLCNAKVLDAVIMHAKVPRRTC